MTLSEVVSLLLLYTTSEVYTNFRIDLSVDCSFVIADTSISRSLCCLRFIDVTYKSKIKISKCIYATTRTIILSIYNFRCSKWYCCIIRIKEIYTITAKVILITITTIKNIEMVESVLIVKEVFYCIY